jgi:hypothetical protein
MITPNEKAPGPNGYTGKFFSHYWDIIKDDILKAIEQFFMLNQQGLHLLN